MTYPRKTRPAGALQNTRLYSAEEAATYLGVSTQTLAHWRCRGCGPRFVALSPRCIRYPETALREWVEANTQRSTAENRSR